MITSARNRQRLVARTKTAVQTTLFRSIAILIGTATLPLLSAGIAAAEPALPAPTIPTPAVPLSPNPTSPNSTPLGLAPAGPTASSPTPTGLNRNGLTSATTPVITPSTLPTATALPISAGTLSEYFAEHDIAMQPQQAADFTALNIVLPMPAGWSVVPDPNVTDAFLVIADRDNGDGLYTPNAQLVVYKLVGDVDPEQAIRHGFIDSQKLFNWQSTTTSMAPFGGFPSSLIEGTYRDNGMTLNSSRRHVIATSGSDHYLVTLTVTTTTYQVVATAEATNAIINRFSVSDPAAEHTAAAQMAPAQPAPAALNPAPAMPYPAPAASNPAPAASNPAPAASNPAPAGLGTTQTRPQISHTTLTPQYQLR